MLRLKDFLGGVFGFYLLGLSHSLLGHPVLRFVHLTIEKSISGRSVPMILFDYVILEMVLYLLPLYPTHGLAHSLECSGAYHSLNK